MKLIYKKLIPLFVLLFVAVGCSKNIQNAPLITDQSAVPRTSAIVIMNVKWVEDYNDADLEVKKIKKSSDLLKEQKKIKELKKWKNKTDLRKPLYYIANLQFNFKPELKTEKSQVIARYNLDLKEYTETAIHQFAPGKVKLNQIMVDLFKFYNPGTKDARAETDHLNIEEYPADFGSWNLEAGKIYYLGDITLYYKTKRIMFGLYPRVQTPTKIELQRISFEKNFDKTRELLKQNDSWFPADKMQDFSIEQSWIYQDKKLIKKTKEELKELEDQKQGTKKKKIKRDTEKFFF